MKDSIILTSNITYLFDTINNLTTSDEKMIGVYAAPGIGKTKAGEYCQAQLGAIYYRAFKMSPYGLLYTLLAPLMVRPKSMVTGLNTLIELLKASKYKAIIIDECDTLNDDCLELIRTIHDLAKIPTVLIGEQNLYGKLKQHDRLFDRTTHLEFTPLDLSDARRFVRELCDVKIDQDMIIAIHTYADGNFRRFKQAVKHVEKTCLLDNVTEVDLETWGKKRSFISDLSHPPSFAKVATRRTPLKTSSVA